MSAPAESHYEGQDLEALADMPRYYEWIMQWFRPHLSGRVLEVGAGAGNFTVHYVDAATEVVLVEPAANLLERLRSRFADRTNVSILHADVAGVGGKFDAAVLVNVLEHVPDDEGTLRRLFDLLRGGGTLLLFVPALPWLYGSLDRLVHHARRYTRASLERVVLGAGFEIRAVRYFDALGVLPWLVAGRVLHAQTFSRRASVLYDRLAVPLASIVERRIAPPLGKNLVCVAQRP